MVKAFGLAVDSQGSARLVVDVKAARGVAESGDPGDGAVSMSARKTASTASGQAGRASHAPVEDGSESGHFPCVCHGGTEADWARESESSTGMGAW